MIYVGLDVSLNSLRYVWWTRPESLSGTERCRRTRGRLCTTSNHGLVKLSGWARRQDRPQNGWPQI